MGNGKITLNQMKDGQEAVVAEIAGAAGLVEKLTSMGIRPGKRITRFCSMFLRGPITVRVDNVQVSLGRGLADKVMVFPGETTVENTTCR